jgi:hypothetical protein
MQKIGDGRRGHGGHVDAGDFDGAGDQFFIAAPHMLAEDDAHAGQFFDFEADGNSSSSRAGFRYSQLALRATKPMPASVASCDWS